jgi:predicted transposase/invertase (TIGR01784 family)
VHKLLDPTLDVVFKLLFTSGPDSEVALRGLLTAVLAPPRPIVSVTVTNPQLAGVELTDKGIVLDLLLELDDGTQIDLEMQADKRPAFRNRALFYWARLFGGLLERGDDYGRLKPAVSILFLDYRELPGDRLHSIFHILEAHDHSRFSDAFEMHVIELPKLAHALLAADRGADHALLRWSKFFNAKTTDEANDPAMSDPAIQKAQSILERLSADPATQEIARQRQKALQTYRIELSAAVDEGVQRGQAGLRAAIVDLCEAYGIVLSAEQQAALERLDFEGLDALRARLKKDRRWT